VIVTGCAETKLVTGNDRSVVVQGPSESWAKTNAVADAHCAKNGLKAQFLYDKEGFPRKYFYDCVR